MSDPQTVVITGAAGNLGGKLRRHLEGRCRLRLLDRDPRGDRDILAAHLSRWDGGWVGTFRGGSSVVSRNGSGTSL